MHEDAGQPRWEEHADGSRSRRVNGIRLIDRTAREPEPEPEPARTPIEHLVAEQHPDGRVVIVALDARCRPVSATTMWSYL